MASDSITFKKVWIHGFRAFRDRQEFDLDASAIVVSGPNGTGKTSFFDAIQWLLLGDISRLAELGSDRRQQEEYIVNQYTIPNPAVVGAELHIGQKQVVLSRSGRADGSILEIASNGEAVAPEDAPDWIARQFTRNGSRDLSTLLTSSALLQQDVMRSLIEAKASHRFEQVSEILGLNQLERFEEAAKQARRARSELVSEARAKLALVENEKREKTDQAARLEEDLKTRPTPKLASESAQNILEAIPWIASIHTPLSDPSSAASLLIALQSIEHTLPSLLGEFTDLQGRWAEFDVSEVDSRLAELRRLMEEDERLLQEARARLQASVEAERSAKATSEQLAQLASLAIPLLSARCPVCGQSIDAAHVEQELLGRTRDSQELTRARDARTKAETDVREAGERLSSHASDLGKLIKEQDLFKENSQRVEEIQARFQTLVLQLDAAGARVAGSDLIDFQATYSQSELSQVVTSLELLVRAHSSEADGQRLSELRSQLKELDHSKSEQRLEIERLSQDALMMEQLAKASTEARRQVVLKGFESIQPVASDIFSRLDPHPSFKRLELEHDVYYGKGITIPVATDEMESRSVHPSLVFSSSQANIFALSLFLALGWAAGERALPFVLLDDPLQSMDDVNVLGFADLCRFLRVDRQLMISTHERRFAHLLVRKLTPRGQDQRTIHLDFSSWDRSGPQVTPHEVEQEPQVARYLVG